MLIYLILPLQMLPFLLVLLYHFHLLNSLELYTLLLLFLFPYSSTLTLQFLQLTLVSESSITPFVNFYVLKHQIHMIFPLFCLQSTDFHKPFDFLWVVHSKSDFPFSILKIYYEVFIIVRQDWFQRIILRFLQHMNGFSRKTFNISFQESHFYLQVNNSFH